MTRKKSRPTHRENTATVPSNEAGFYKMFWNSMDNPGNGPNSPSQGDVPVTSPPVIILGDSPAGSPCAHDENSYENLVVPLPIKEEIREDAVEISNQKSSTATNSENLEESHSGINGYCSSHQTCLPGNPLMSTSKNSSLSPSHTDLISQGNQSQTSNFNPISTCVDSSASEKVSSNVACSYTYVSSKQPQEPPPTAEEGADLIEIAEDIQVCDKVTTEEQVEMFPEGNVSKVLNSNDDSEEISSNNYEYVVSNQSHSVVDNSGGMPPPPGVSVASPICEGILEKTPAHGQEIPNELGVSISDLECISGGASYISDELPKLTPEQILEETPMDVPSQPPISHVNNEEPLQEPSGDIFDPRFATVINEGNNEENIEEQQANDIQGPPSPALSEGTGRTLSLLQSLLNAPDEDLEDFNEAFPELPALIGQRNDLPDLNRQDEGEMVEFESAQESSFHNIAGVSNMDFDQSATVPENILSVDANVRHVPHQYQTNAMIVDEEDEFPTYSNFLPRKIKLDSIGVSRAAKFLRDSVRALYKEYLKDDIILQTVSIPEPPPEKGNESSDEVEETPTFPPINVYPICCVKMERLPDPFVKKSTVTMSDDTFKTWKRQIIRQRNEEKFRHLKVWRRGRTLLWRECELAGMDRATYDEQVAYVKKHKLNENSSSDSDSAGDESGNDASSHQCDSSESDYSDLENEDSELSSMNSYGSPSPNKHKSSENQPIASTRVEPETSSHISLPGDEYVVERTSTNQSCATKAPAALKITIRKASMSKSEDDKEKPVDEGESLSIPAQPTVHKPRRIATKRTYRRPSDPVPKASAPPKSAVADTKKSKTASVRDEDLYDQSLLGRRSYEVENFNLLEKWDIPFEEPTLFRSPRAASRLAQLRTKEAFASGLKRHAHPKTASTATTFTTTTTTAAVTTDTVGKIVKDVVDMLCSKTVQAILFPESKLAGPKKPTPTDVVNSVDAKDSRAHMQPNEVPSKSSVPNEETSSNLDESSEMSQSETNSTLDASSDFGGSTPSLVSEDFIPPKNKSPTKSRRRRRFGPAWGKKKKVKGKATDEQPFVKESSKTDEQTVKDRSDSTPHCTEHPVAEKCKPIQGVGTSPAHSTQVPVVSEGPGQSPHESEDDSAHRMKERIRQNESNHIPNKSAEKKQPTVVIKRSQIPSKESQLNITVQEEVILPRLTRSKQPTIELDPELLENFGTRKRKPKTDLLDDASQDEETSKKIKQGVTTKMTQKSRAQSIKPSNKVPEELSSVTSRFVSDDSNTQVPEVSEGPGEIGLDHEDKQDQENKAENWEPPVRMLRSRSRGPGPRTTESTNDTKINESVQEDKLADDSQLEEPVVLESPQSPPPETVEAEPLINSRITRSKKRRSGPAYVAVKSTVASALPAVCDIVDSIAGRKLPTLSKLFDASNPKSSLATEPITSFRVQTSNNVDDTPLVHGKVPTGSSTEFGQQPGVVPCESLGGQSIQPCTELEGTSLDSTPKYRTSPVVSDGSIGESVTKSAAEVVGIVGQTSGLLNNSINVEVSNLPTDSCQSAAAVDCGLGTVAVERGMSSGVATASGSHALEKPVTENVGSGRLKVLDTLNSILAVTSPKKVRHPVTITSPLLPPSLSSNHLQVTPPTNTSVSQPSVTNILTPPAVNSTSLPSFLTTTQDMNSILPGTFLNSLISSSIDASLTTYGNEMNDSTSLADDPDGDLVIDEGEAPEPDTRIDVNFWENLTNADLDTQADSDANADFSDDDNNTDLADKIDKIIKEQIHQDPVPVPSLKPKGTSAGSSDGHEKAPEETSLSKTADKNASALSRRDSIDDRTGLPNNLIQRLRDPRIRSRLLSQLEEVETNDKTPQANLTSLQNNLPLNNVNSSTVGEHPGEKIISSDPLSKVDGVAVHAVSYMSVCDGNSSSCMNTQVPAVSQVFSHPAMGAHLETINSVVPGQPSPLVVPNTSAPNTTVVTSGILGQLPLVVQQTPIEPLENSDKPEEPPDPSKVDFLVPPSDDEEEESVKRRPKKAKKEVDVELMYKSPLEDLQSEARPAYGERAPRRYAESFSRRRSGDDRRARWDDRRSRDDQRSSRDRSRDRRFEDHGRSSSRDRRYDDRGRSRSRDRRFDDRGRDRSRSRDRRTYYDHPPRDQSRDRRAYDPYPGTEDPETTPHHVEMQVPYNHSPWPAFHHHQAVMMHPLESPRWQQNYYPEPNVQPHPPIFVPEPPKIDYMETRLINLELLPKTTNLEVTPVKKVFSYFDKDSLQVFPTPPPTYDPNDQPHTIKMMDPVSEEMIDFIQTPRPTSGLTKEVFRHVPPDLNLDDVVKFHFISPAYVMVRDNEEDPSSSSDEEEEIEAKQKMLLHHRKHDSKPVLEHGKRVSKPVLEHRQKRETKPTLEHHSKRRESESIPGDLLKPASSSVPEVRLQDDPLQNILQSLPLLREYSMQKSQPPLIPPPPPEWNDVDLRISREIAAGKEDSSLSGRDPSPPKERSKNRSRSRSNSPYRSRRSKSPRRRYRSRSRSLSSRSDMSISPSRSRSRSPSYSRKGSRTPRRRRSRSRSSERSRSSRSRRSRSPKRHSTSISPSRRPSRR